MKIPAKRIALLAMLCAMSLIMFMIENLFPAMFVPGAKMGLSNVFTMLAVLWLSPIDAIILVIIRTTLGGLFTNVSTLIYSLTAGLVSVTYTIIIIRTSLNKVSLLAVSVTSAVLHNLTQNLVYCLSSQTPEMMGYMPYLALAGILAGSVVGLAVYTVTKMIKPKTILKMVDYENSCNQ
ncbi:MAG: Gx transporter family protein [Clostridia bacterium]|nr:Gx transporter family protein [Clostridia bacterium]